MSRLNAIIVFLVILVLRPFHALAWNIPGHMLSGAIAYQILQRESPTAIAAVRAMLEKNPWYETRWKSQLEKLPDTERDEMLFMLGARWADDIRTRDKGESRLPWHYVDFPFKPEGEPASIQATEPPQENILTAIAVNERVVRSGSGATKRGIALSWLFHLIGDIHPPVHAVTLFSREYPKGDEGGTEIEITREFLHFAITLLETKTRQHTNPFTSERSNPAIRRQNTPLSAMLDEKWQVYAAESGPPGNQNVFRHGLTGIAQRRADGALNPAEQSIREEILTGLLADKGGAAQISTAMRVLAEIIASDVSLLVTFNHAIYGAGVTLPIYSRAGVFESSFRCWLLHMAMRPSRTRSVLHIPLLSLICQLELVRGQGFL